MARGAGLVGEVEQCGRRAGENCGAVALQARHSQVRPFQSKARRLMLRERELRRLKTLQPVATFASVFMWRRGELGAMLVGVAVGAGAEGDLVLGCRAGRRVAVSAGNFDVLSFERVSRGGMFLHAECGRLEAFHIVAGRALRSPRSLLELYSVRIGSVAIHAPGMSK